MNHRGAQPLSRHDIETRKDRPTNSLIVQYVGRHLHFDDELYGYPDGVFFAISMDEVPLPDELQQLADRHGLNIDALPEVATLKKAVAECLAAEAAAMAPDMLSDFARPRAFWHPWDERELQRKHRIASSKVLRHVKLVENEIRLRVSGLTRPTWKVDVPTLPEPAPPPLYAEPVEQRVIVEQAPAPPPAPAPAPAPTIVLQTSGEEGCEPCGDEDGSMDYLPSSLTVKRAHAAMTAAREDELPQRLPSGMRRRLRSMMPGSYVVVGETADIRGDLCAAMNDARNRGRKGRETTVISWDGEWPVVVRRYGQGGRVIYKVETALKRHGIAVPEVK
jgi:hypothetical protein